MLKWAKDLFPICRSLAGPGNRQTLKYFFKRKGKIFLEAANIAYEPIELNLNEADFQGKLLAVWRKI